MLDLFVRFAHPLKQLQAEIQSTINLLQAGQVFTPPQGLCLAAAVLAREPEVILDLGTGSGASCCCMALASRGARVFTFDINPNWEKIVAPKLTPRREWECLVPIQADIGTFDFSEILGGVKRVLVFWDAHGFSVAARVFSHIMPLIADVEHLVLCHDMSDARLYRESTDHLSYKGKRMWRGTDDYFRNFSNTAPLLLGWMETPVEQGIAIQDFCYRNKLALRTVDQDVHLESTPEQRRRLEAELYPDGIPSFHVTYFSMNDNTLRNFPAG